MKMPDVRTSLRRLAFVDAMTRLGFRLIFWAVSAFLAWGIILIVATVTALPVEVFHAVVMGAIGSLPAFLAAPFSSSGGTDTVRRIDREAAVESWLSYAGGPAERLLSARAVEAISIAHIAGYGKPRLSRRSRSIVTTLACAGILAFVSAQILSIMAGYGLSIRYPDKINATGNVLRTGRFDDSMMPGTVPEALAPEADRADAPGARRYGRGEEEEDALASPLSFGKAEPGTEAAGVPETGAGPLSGSDGPGRMASKTGDPVEAHGQASGDGDGGPDTGTEGEARAPGYEGSGGALDSSPLVDYRARFERQYASVSGKETSLGQKPSSDIVSAAIADYYASFDARVAIVRTEDRAALRAMEGWRRAFGTGSAP